MPGCLVSDMTTQDNLYQELFDRIYRHAVSMDKPSEGPNGLDCAYRSPDGSRCLIGCLIPDHKYNPRMEGKGITILIMDSIGVPHDMEPFLEACQCAHDEFSPISSKWKKYMLESLSNIAKDYGLNIPDVEASEE